MKNYFIWVGALLCALWVICYDDSISSPSDSLIVDIQQSDQQAIFNVLMNDEKVSSVHLGIELADEKLFFPSDDVSFKLVDENDSYNEYILSQSSAHLQVRLRVFDNALAFRYEGVGESGVHVSKELSAWTLPAKTMIWYFERKNAWKLKSYAGTWEHSLLEKLTEVASTSIQGTPIVFQLTSGKYGFISEAALENYSGMRLEADAKNTFSVNFTEGEKGFDVPGELKSPWRVLFIGDDLNALVNQQVIKELAPRPDMELYTDLSYIQPGKCAWRWFAKGTGTPEQERQVIDEAAQMNFSYSLVDDGWKTWKDCWREAEDLVSYARAKGIRLLFWQHSRPLRESSNDYEGMKNFLDSIARIGAAGVKVDFMDSEAKPLVDFEIKLLRECAKRKLIVNFHGCQAPSGETYTYPNELTREGIRGLELNKMREGYIPAYHNASLPFTRFIVGHGDYTPLSFTVPGTTTFAHQLATLVCFDSPLQTIAEDPGLLLTEELVSGAVGFIRDVPTVWDEVKVLPQSEIASMAVIAKRKGSDWYIGVLNGEPNEKTLALDLSPFCVKTAKIEAYIDHVDAERVLLPMEGYRPCALKREASVPFKLVKDVKTLYQLKLASEGGAVFVIRN